MKHAKHKGKKPTKKHMMPDMPPKGHSPEKMGGKTKAKAKKR